VGSGKSYWSPKSVNYIDLVGKKKENKMKPRTKNELNGKMYAMKGAVKQTADQIINNSNFNAEGHDEKVARKVQERIGQVEKVLEKYVDSELSSWTKAISGILLPLQLRYSATVLHGYDDPSMRIRVPLLLAAFRREHRSPERVSKS
jgi:uncharacterized protein YjbJ (UPF0337 family)